MTAFAETSQSKLRPRGLRKDRLPKSPAAEAAAPFKDPQNGRFTAGNPGGRLRQLAALARVTAGSLLKLESPEVAPWLRPHLLDAQRHVQALIDALPAATDELVALCADEARARLMISACTTEGAREQCDAKTAREWREEARLWMREARQIVLTRKAIAKDTPKPRQYNGIAPPGPARVYTEHELATLSDAELEALE